MTVTINGTTGIVTPDIDSVDATFTGTVSGAVPAAIDVNASAPADSVAIDASGNVTLTCAAGASNIALQAYHPTSTSARNIAKFQSNVGSTQNDQLVIECGGNLKFNSGYGSAATAYGCRAWVNLEANASPAAIRASGGVSSVTDNSAGDYQINFSFTFPDNDYALSGMTSDIVGLVNVDANVNQMTTTNVEIAVVDSRNASKADYEVVSVMVVR